jgi:hypothetical protein
MVTIYIATVSNNKRIDELRTELRDLRADIEEGFQKLEERFEHLIRRP